MIGDDKPQDEGSLDFDTYFDCMVQDEQGYLTHSDQLFKLIKKNNV